MAGDWIKFELATLDKPEVCQIADLADIDPDAVVGKLMRVWGWFDQQTEQGNAPSVTKKLLDRMVGVSGFCEHMKSVRWMVEADGLISLPHFDRHNGKTAKNRSLTAKRVANHKSGNAKTNAESNAASVSDALPREEKIYNTHTLSHDPRQPVEMSLDWVPDEKQLKAVAFRAGVTAEQCQGSLGAYVIHHQAKAVMKTEAEWIAGLVSWAKRDSVQQAAKPSNVSRFPSKAAPDFHSGDTSWADDLGAL